MTQYCRICTHCTKEDGTIYYRCNKFDRTKTERQICHTTACRFYAEREDRNDIVTGLFLKQRIRKNNQTKLFTQSTPLTFWQRVKQFAAKFEALAHHA